MVLGMFVFGRWGRYIFFVFFFRIIKFGYYIKNKRERFRLERNRSIGEGLGVWGYMRRCFFVSCRWVFFFVEVSNLEKLICRICF